MLSHFDKEYVKSVRRFYPVFGILLLVAVMSCPGRAATPDDASLDNSLDKFESLEGNEFPDLCQKLNRPCGVEEAHLNDTTGSASASTVHLEKTSPRKILDRSVGRMPGYQWVMRDGVINLEPKKRDGEDVLSRKLDSVSISSVTSFKAALDVLKQANIPVSYQPTGRVRLAFVDLELKNVTVREALNAIVKADGQAMWFITSGSKGRTFILISWRRSGATSIHERRKSKVGAESK